MAQFSSEADRKKWESLQHSAGTSLSNIVSGRATASDFSRVATVLNNLNGLAAQVFAHAVSAAEVQAKKFEAQYDNALKLRDNETLTAYELALNQALKQIAPDIVSDIQDAIQYGFIEQTDELNRTLGSKFSDFEQLLPPRDLPTVNDVLASNELLAEHISATDDQKWETREDSLVERILAGFKSTLRDIAESVQRAKASASSGAGPGAPGRSLVPHTGFESHLPHLDFNYTPKQSADWEVVDDDVPALMQAHQSLLAGPQAAPNAIEALHAPTGTVASPSALPKGRDEPSISLSSRAEASIVKAADNQTNLYKQLLDFLTGEAGPTGKGAGQAEGKEDEEEKADTWWRSFKNWMGDPAKKYKEFKKDNAGWLSALGSALSLMILDPQLFKSFGDLIEKYVTWDNIKSAAFAAWDWVSAQAGNVVDWVMEKLDLNKKLKDGAQGVKENSPVAPILNAANEKGTSTLQKIGDALVTPGEQQWISQNILHSKGIGQTAQAIGDALVTPGQQKAISNAWNFVTGGHSADTTVTGGSSTSVGGTTVGGNRSSLTSNNSYQATTPVDASPVSMTPGTMTTPPGVSGDSGSPASMDTRNIKGTPQAGMSSFSFSTGIDDSLRMMNTHYFTG